ncbi:hypothetical protein CFO_g339 [Ceratocystis platani]|uniref:Uncharacterized protein n=1 Tax=Ceratocystis fimbriata f. sp. platani TaxID=88771 RepID=A0A0F8DMZ5_CERFI|nr:hypothetical protein CFO_g339 [Ceratocystis platani]
MESFEAQCERDEDKETAQVVKRMILSRAEEAMDYVLTGREGGWQNRPAGEPAKKAHERQGKTVEKPPSAATKKAPSFADMVKRPATKPADTQDAARETKSDEAASQTRTPPLGVTHSQRPARTTESCLRELDPELKKALKDVQKTKSGFALLANKDGHSTLLEKSDKIKNYIGPGTEVVQAVNTDAYLIGPIERYLNGGGRTVEVSEEIIGECFAQATRVTPVYMTSKTRGNEKMRDCESFLMTEKLKKLDAGLGKAPKNVQKTKSGFALTAHKDGRATLLEKSDKIKKYLRPGTEIAQALNTDAYLIGPVVRHLNGGGKAVEVTEEMIRVCFAQATRIAPVYMTSKTRGNEKTFIAKIPASRKPRSGGPTGGSGRRPGPRGLEDSVVLP